MASCNRYFHFPCAAASSCYQEKKSLSLFCNQHLGQVPLMRKFIFFISVIIFVSFKADLIDRSIMIVQFSFPVNGDMNGEMTCVICNGLGDVANLIICSVCGRHYHGKCVGLALYPDVRTGWQCTGCRTCQVCRQGVDPMKAMLCERCEKVYHPGCLRPIVTSIPKYGWKCKCCRVCTDCGSRTPGAGLSSR